MLNINKFLKYFFSVALLVSCVSVSANTTKNYVNDAAITTSVKAKLLADKTVSGTAITVETKNGVVYLTGTVKSDTEASNAIQIAESANGVKDVDTTQLTVQESNQPVSDTFITAKVKGQFLKEKAFGDNPIAVTSINVETKNGVVYLTGTVNDKRQARTAVNLAKSVKGVKSVDSQLEVSAQG